MYSTFYAREGLDRPPRSAATRAWDSRALEMN